MKLSLPLLLVICLIGYGYSTQVNDETKTQVICEDCEYTHLNLDENALDKMRLVKLQNCMVQKKRQFNKDEQEKAVRIARSTNEQEEQPAENDKITTFDKLFSTSATFKRVLAQYLKLKDSIIKKTAELQQQLGEVLTDLSADYEIENNGKKPVPQTPSLKETVQVNDDAKCNKNLLTCSDKPNHVIRIKSGLLTSQNNEKMCPKSVDWSFNLKNLNETCFETIRTTRKLAELCDGEKECEVSISTDFNTICDCTEKKHMEVEYTCEMDDQESTAKRSKRSLYYRKDERGQRMDNRYRQLILDYYDRFYDFSDYYLDDYCDYYNYYNYYDNYYYYDYFNYGYNYDLCNYDYSFALSAKGKPAKQRSGKATEAAIATKESSPEGLRKLSATVDQPAASPALLSNRYNRRPSQKSYGASSRSKYPSSSSSYNKNYNKYQGRNVYKKRQPSYSNKYSANKSRYGSKNSYRPKSGYTGGYPRQ